ncbi:MAG: hypothetical protein A3I11_07595 [Elusimicrobia bacterium RIFCSPLOWO2_02_FULL_39_32]|nr:MAG: hypothetical protein UU09_C0003G0019 [Microgenomates group bacterium GW2011_GWA2_40_6]OGR81385.1 MAG: hypothetical protein A3B80_05030 [Elusimicrobia bacterium RIFCSPHIGHO2_02_FULL_39_36]OGR92048.1 MAG: hypothetical protein A3I11_07595 [Elusimicrobia bacterium RIFCSPLOWO2_02_FULL_39_32]OGR98661.1 MAG: hypothetical protein A3G85_04835 [Elusimicrobia bacterium RIFCSPLOWO2_12_FULL_39_28]
MKKYFKKIFKWQLLLLLSAFSLLLTNGIGALEISPEHFTLEAEVGKKIKNQIILKNPSQKKVKVTLHFLPCSSDEKMNRKKWVKFSQKKFFLNQEESKTIQLTCKVPKKAKGELLGIVMIKAENPLEPFMEIRYLHPLTMRIKGTEKVKAKLTKVEAKKNNRSILLYGAIKNEGNIRIKPKLIVEILNLRGELDSKVLDPKINEIKPEEEINFTAEFPLRNDESQGFGTLKLFYKDVKDKIQMEKKGFKIILSESALEEEKLGNFKEN